MRRIPILVAAVALAAGNAAGQNGWALEVEYMPGSGGAVSPAFPAATVRLLARFDPWWFAFAGGDGDVIAQEGSWSDLRLLDVQDPPVPPWPGSSPGLVIGSRVNLYIVGQVLVGPGFMPSRANPMPLWEGTWSTEDFSPRSIGVVTGNHGPFALYNASGKNQVVTPTHGSAVIQVVPAPGALAALIAALPVAAGRRRGRADKEPLR
jgi:ABC-type amino acid transport substrate-binding protein